MIKNENKGKETFVKKWLCRDSYYIEPIEVYVLTVDGKLTSWYMPFTDPDTEKIYDLEKLDEHATYADSKEEAFEINRKFYPSHDKLMDEIKYISRLFAGIEDEDYIESNYFNKDDIFILNRLFYSVLTNAQLSKLDEIYNFFVIEKLRKDDNDKANN